MSVPVLVVMDYAIAALARGIQASQLVRAAQAEGRDISDGEWASVLGADDAARQRLVDEIAKAKQPAA